MNRFVSSPATCIIALWLVWVTGWLLSAGWTRKTVLRESLASRLSYSVPIWIGALLILPDLVVFPALEIHLVPREPWIAWIAAAIVAAGLGFTVWARVHLGRLWSGVVTLKEEHAVVRSGPYAFVRHPIYTGLVAAMLGTAVARGTLAAFLGLPLIVAGFVIKLRKEERLLVGHLGDAYRDYQAAVPALVPRLHRVETR